jgi:hypothetical protein
MLYKSYRKFYFYVYCCDIFFYNTSCSESTYMLQSQRMQDFCKEIPYLPAYHQIVGVKNYAPTDSRKKFLFEITQQFKNYNSAIIMRINSIIMCICTLNNIPLDQMPENFHSIPKKIVIELIESMCKTVSLIYEDQPLVDKDLKVILRFILFIYSLSNPLKKEKHKDKQKMLTDQRGEGKTTNIDQMKDKLRSQTSGTKTTNNLENDNNPQKDQLQNLYKKNNTETEESYYLNNIYNTPGHKINPHLIGRLISTSTLYAPFGHNQIKYDSLLLAKYEAQERARKNLSEISKLNENLSLVSTLDITDEEVKIFKKNIEKYTQSTIINIEECVFNFTTSLLCKLIPGLKNNINNSSNTIQNILDIHSFEDKTILNTLQSNGIKAQYQLYIMMCLKMRNQLQTVFTEQLFDQNHDINFLIAINTRKQVFANHEKQSIYNIFIKRRIKIRSCEILSNFYRRFFLKDQNKESTDSIYGNSFLTKSVILSFSNMQLRKQIASPINIINYIKNNDIDFFREEKALKSIEEQKTITKEYLENITQELNLRKISISNLKISYLDKSKEELEVTIMELDEFLEKCPQHQQTLQKVQIEKSKELLNTLLVLQENILILIEKIKTFLDQAVDVNKKKFIIEQNKEKLEIIQQEFARIKKEPTKPLEINRNIQNIKKNIENIINYINILDQMDEELKKVSLQDEFFTEQKTGISNLKIELTTFEKNLQICLIFSFNEKLIGKCTKYNQLIEEENLTIEQCDEYLKNISDCFNTLEKEITAKLALYPEHDDYNTCQSNLKDIINNLENLKQKIQNKKINIEENLKKNKEDKVLINMIQSQLDQHKTAFSALEKIIIPPYTQENKNKIEQQIKQIKKFKKNLEIERGRVEQINLRINKEAIIMKIERREKHLKKRKNILREQTVVIDKYIQEQKNNMPIIFMSGFGGISLVGISIWKSQQSNNNEEDGTQEEYDQIEENEMEEDKLSL